MQRRANLRRRPHAEMRRVCTFVRFAARRQLFVSRTEPRYSPSTLAAVSCTRRKCASGAASRHLVTTRSSSSATDSWSHDLSKVAGFLVHLPRVLSDRLVIQRSEGDDVVEQLQDRASFGSFGIFDVADRTDQRVGEGLKTRNLVEIIQSMFDPAGSTRRMWRQCRGLGM